MDRLSRTRVTPHRLAVALAVVVLLAPAAAVGKDKPWLEVRGPHFTVISNAGEKRTLVEEGTSFQGSMTSTCPVVVKGRIEGELEAPALSISETGAVQGKAKVGVLDSQGSVAGEIDADSVNLSGSVMDNTLIKAKTLEVKLNAAADKKMHVTFGNCEMAVGTQPVDDGQPGKRGKKKNQDAGQPEDGSQG